MWCHKHLKSLPCPRQKSLPFSLSSALTCSLSLSCLQAGNQAQLQNAPSAFTEDWGCLKGSTHCQDCRALPLRTDRDTHCFSIYWRVNDFLFPIAAYIILKVCFRNEALTGGTKISFPFLGFHCTYMQMKHLSQIQDDLPWVSLLSELPQDLCLQLWEGANPTQETSSSEKITQHEI